MKRIDQKKREFYKAQYPKGTIVELVAPIADPYSPKPAGSRFEVDHIDDQLQMHGRWLAPQSGSLAVIIEEDSFRVVKEAYSEKEENTSKTI